MNKSNKFTWLPFFNAMLKKTCSEYDKKSLFNVFYRTFGDKFNNKHIILLNNPGEMDPFTFIAMFNSNDLEERRQEYCSIAKEILKLKEEAPSDFEGIPPFFKAVRLRFFYILDLYNEFNIFYETMDSLWKLAKDVINNNGTGFSDEIGEKLDIAIKKIERYKYKNAISERIKTELSWTQICQTLFICFPNQFFPVDIKVCKYAGIKKPRLDTFEDFKNFQEELRNKFNEPPYMISYKAYDRA